MNDKFTFRELKSMKKIIKDSFKDKVIDFEEILFKFPGKSLKRVTEVFHKMMAAKKNKTMTSIEINKEN